MELRETIESINEKLVSEFGVDIECAGQPKFRVIFSEDVYEKRITEYNNDGMKLMFPEVRSLPKYKQWIKAKYILERLIPILGETDLVEKVGYEPIWVFQDRNGNYLPPFFDGCVHVINSMYQAMGRANTFTKYKDQNISQEEHLAHLKKVEDELFGNETSVGDALHCGYGVVVPGNDKLH